MKMTVTMDKDEAEALLKEAFTARALSSNFEVESIRWRDYDGTVTFNLKSVDPEVQLRAALKSWVPEPLSAEGLRTQSDPPSAFRDAMNHSLPALADGTAS